ncbi:recombinase family protein [Micromonospora sp. NPDC050686]|uniref:recombinase family protein n=1 Tax=Micromonospora sp. NPDC050686 TaxID=3154631 RepID=UPI0033C34014
MGEPVPLRCAIYCRISQDRESEEKGVKDQEADCRELVAAYGWQVVDVFVDNDLSASTKARKPRPRFEEMMRQAEAGLLDVLVSLSNGRLTRRPLELERLITLHEARGTLLYTVKSGNDNLSTADGRMVARIKAAVDTAEAERTGERVERAARRRREAGELHGGSRTFGYVHGSPLGYCREVDTVAAKAIRDGMEVLFQTRKVSEVRKLWQRMGVRTPLGKEWTNDGNVARTLRNPRIAGLVAHDGETVGEGNWPAIITRAEHEAILDALGTRGAKRKGGTPRARKYLLPGFVFCMCGTPMSAQVYDPPGVIKYSRYNRYVCISQRGGCGQCSRHRPWLEDVVREWVAGAIEGRISVPEGQADDPNPAIEAELRELEAGIKRMRNSVAKGVFSDDEALEEIIPMRRRIQELRAKQGELVRQAALIPVDKDEELDDWLDDDPETLHRRREILGRYVKRIIVKPVGKGGSNGVDGPPIDSVVIVPRD